MIIDRFATGHPACRIFIESLVLAHSTTQTFSEADAEIVAEVLNEILPEV